MTAAGNNVVYVSVSELERLKMKARRTPGASKWLKMGVAAGILVCLLILYRLWASEPSIVPGIGDSLRPAADLAGQSSSSGPADDRRVHLQVFMESQCPDTTYFMNKQLWPVYQELKQYLALEIIPFGKAFWQQRGDDYSFECQHGPRECDENQMMCCGLSRLPKDPDRYLPYLLCLQDRDVKEAAVCNERAGLKVDEMLECATGREGRMLHYEAGVKTKALKPRMTFVPWVVINGVRYREAHQRLKHFICKAFSPSTKPREC